jgi:DNA-binding NtrC family response regulator
LTLYKATIDLRPLAFGESLSLYKLSRKGITKMKGKILVVDDEKEYANVLAERLQIKGYQTKACYSGKEALVTLRDCDMDVVVLDLVMPEMDGIDVLKEIKKVKPQVEVIMLSGKATREDAIRGIQSGAFEHLGKPCNDDKLEAIIEGAQHRKLAFEKRLKEALDSIQQAIDNMQTK